MCRTLVSLDVQIISNIVKTKITIGSSEVLFQVGTQAVNTTQ